MMRHWRVAGVACVLLFAGNFAVAQQHDPKQHDPKAHGQGQPDTSDARALVALPAAMAKHMLINMRDHLLVLHEINAALARGDTDTAAQISEQRLGMTSLALHGADHMAPLMPEGMREIGSQMHRSASRFAISARDAGATGDIRPALAALAAVTSHCVTCHAAYRVK